MSVKSTTTIEYANQVAIDVNRYFGGFKFGEETFGATTFVTASLGQKMPSLDTSGYKMPDLTTKEI